MRAVLRDTFGLTRLRPGQAPVIERVLAGQPTLAVMPTGAGKSLCYQLPALLLQGRTVVVSPLIALMKDQCESLRSLGIPAVQVNSANGSEEARAAEVAVADGSARIIMTTPERLAEPAFQELLLAHPIALLAVDEAHCISQWGHDFRPAFLEVGQLLGRLGRPSVLALTATATDEIAADICKQLGIPPQGVVNTSSYRPNLDLRVLAVAREADKLAQARKLVRASEGSGIIYTATVKAAQAVYEALRGDGESVGIYHGKLAAAERHAEQEAFMAGQRRVMVATNAFGLGIDKADIRFVLHYQLPATLEAYYQEAGRAGRDGQPARCTLLFLRGDKAIQQFFMAGRYPGEEDAAAVVQTLQQDPPEGADAWTLQLLQGRVARPRSKVQVALGLLRKDKIVAQARDGALRLIRKVTDNARVRALTASYGRKRDLDRQALERMVAYAQTGQCRWRLVLDHLEGGSPMERCTHCDNCRRIAAHEAVVDELLRSAPQSDAQELATAATTAFARGDLVEVRRYGRGVVEEASATQVVVAFADRSRRNFLPEFVRRAKAVGTGRKQRMPSGPAIAAPPAVAVAA